MNRLELKIGEFTFEIDVDEKEEVWFKTLCNLLLIKSEGLDMSPSEKAGVLTTLSKIAEILSH